MYIVLLQKKLGIPGNTQVSSCLRHCQRRAWEEVCRHRRARENLHGAVRPLLDLMVDPESEMLDKVAYMLHSLVGSARAALPLSRMAASQSLSR